MEKYFNLKDENEIVLRQDQFCKMASVEVNGKCIMLGYYWDFHNGCHGFYDIPEFNSSNELVRVIKGWIEEQGKTYTMNYDFEWKYKQ